MIHKYRGGIKKFADEIKTFIISSTRTSSVRHVLGIRVYSNAENIRIEEKSGN